MQTFQNIAVLRASGLGDFIFALPALSALRETFPTSHIVYLGKKWHQEFLAKRKTVIDKVIVIPPVGGVGMDESYQTDSVALQTFYDSVQAEKFDLAVQLHGGGKYSNQFIRELGAPFAIGTKTENALPLDKTIPYHYYQNESARLLEVVSLVGARTKNIAAELPVTMDDKKEAELVFLRENQCIVLHPGATDYKRQWPYARFAHVGDYFAKRGFTIVVTGSGDEEMLVEEVIRAMHYPAINVCNKLSLPGLAGILSFADLVIANDTGPLHLADAVGCKTVGLYWGPNLINAAPFFRSHTICLSSWIVRCPLCNQDCVSEYPFEIASRTCRHETSFTSDISVADVITAASSLLIW